jgi:hypothetical protein
MLNAPRHCAVPRPLTRAAATAVAACFLVVAGWLMSGAVPSASAQPMGPSAASVVITSVNPPYAEPGTAVTVSGTLTNNSSDSMSALSVQLRSSSVAFGGRDDLQEYASGSLAGVDSPLAGAVTYLSGTLAPHATANWSVEINPGELPMRDSKFGVYPLAAQALSAYSGSLSTSRTFLPFWSNSPGLDPSAEQVSWIWPLIDQPRQTMCSGLTDNDLASSIGTGGRLAGLLTTGARYASSAHLTWAIDPALLANVSTMTSQYQVDTSDCQGTTHPASPAAEDWLALVRTATAGQPVVATPYDDPDIAALVNDNMNTDLTRAFTEGRQVASKLLNRNFGVTATGTAASLNGAVWPADGVADYAVLENLAASDKINTVILDSSTMPPSSTVPYTPSAQSATPDGVGPELNVLLSDDTITKLLNSADSPSTSAGTAFAVSQEYLAQTAMIAAEEPNLARSIVVAPPRRWDPPAGLANELLSETVSAPWLRTASLSTLASARNPSGEVARQVPTASSNAELGKPLLDQASALDQQVKVLASIQASPAPGYVTALDNAVAAVESSAWRGDSGQGAALAQQASAYLATQERKVTIIQAPHARVTLGGLTGSVPVSISNHLGFAVRIGLQATPTGQMKVKDPFRVITVPAEQQEIVKLQVTASTVGSRTLQVWLVTPQGGAYPAQSSIIVQATNYGNLALIIIGGGLGVLLVTAAARAIRRRSRPPQADGGTPAPVPGTDPGRSGDGAEDVSPVQPGEPTGPAQADNLMHSGRVSISTADHDTAEATGDYAWAPGQSERR